MGPSILSVPGYTGYSYIADPESILALVVLCPLCLRDDVEHRLARNGRYPRHIPTDRGAGEPGWIYRKRCSRCRVSFALLPDFIPMGLRYPCLLVADWLWAALQGTSCRSRAFLERHRIPCPAEESEHYSWTYLLDFERTQPGYQTLARWVTRFSARALTAVPTLMTACIALGCDLKAEAERFSGLVLAPARAFPIAVALLLWSALRGTGKPLESELESLVHYLLWHPRPSQERRRARPWASRYAGLAVTGRAPPPATSLRGGPHDKTAV